MLIRVLTEEDAAALQAVRLRSLREHPEAYGAAYEDECETPVEQIAERLRPGSPTGITFGAFGGETLVGIVQLGLSTRPKSRHRGQIYAVYVAPEARGQGAGRALMEAALAEARARGLEQVALGVTVGNDAARALYVSLGFRPFGIEPRSLKVEEEYFDMEWMVVGVGETLGGYDD